LLDATELCPSRVFSSELRVDFKSISFAGVSRGTEVFGKSVLTDEESRSLEGVIGSCLLGIASNLEGEKAPSETFPLTSC